jgi:hypothetical protein
MSPVTILSVVLPKRLRALSGHISTHLGSPLQTSQIIGLCVLGFNWIAPYSQASKHQPQPSHFAASTVTVPVEID